MNCEFPVYHRNNISVLSGTGYWLRAAGGGRYLDFYAGHAVAALGYGHPAMVAALEHQACKLTFQSNAIDLDVRSKAARALAAASPEGLDSVFFVNSGAEANENALRVAFLLTGRNRVVAVEGAFHGRTAAASACSYGSEPWYGFPRAPFEVSFVPRNDVAALKAAVSNDVAAVIVEPVQGLAGAIALSGEFLVACGKRCEETGAFFIADEVQTGIGRTGTMFAIEQAGVTPDMMTVGKGLAGGMPAAAVIAKSAIASQLKKGSLGTTFGGGPLVCATILAVLNEVNRPAFLENVRAMSEAIILGAKGRLVKEVSGKGLLLGLHTAVPAKEVIGALRDSGVIVGDAKDPNVVRLLPPLIIDEDAVERFLTALDEVEDLFDLEETAIA